MSTRREFANWDALRAYISERYEEVTEFAHEFIRFRAHKNEHSAWIKLRMLGESEPMWIYFLSKVCPEKLVDPRAILYRSGETPIGEMSLFGDFLVIGQRVPMAGLNSETVETIVDALVTERAFLIKDFAKEEQASPADVFSHLTE